MVKGDQDGFTLLSPWFFWGDVAQTVHCRVKRILKVGIPEILLAFCRYFAPLLIYWFDKPSEKCVSDGDIFTLYNQ